jgi:FkbM family methyltransferase
MRAAGDEILMLNKVYSSLPDDSATKLLRAARIIKNPKRWTEIGWRLLFRAFREKSILEMVKLAYLNSQSPEATLLRHCAEVSWGLADGNVAKTRAYTHVAYQLQALLAKEPRSLGPVRIGFEDLEIHARTSDADSSRVYLAGFSESLTLFEAYRRAIAPGTIAVDVGANIGAHSLVLSRCVGKNSQVYSYEPSRALCERFNENMTLNRIENLTLRNVGLGATNSTMRFQPREDQFSIGLGKLDAKGSVEVDVVTLDSDLQASNRISLIKIDVEGNELDVLRGARTILSRHRPALVIECNTDWTLDELRDTMPYPVKITSIPDTLLEQPRDLQGISRNAESQNVLVQPVQQDQSLA